jgi:hypothetical protein
MDIIQPVKMKRWRIAPIFDDCGREEMDLVHLFVATPRGTGPRAFGVSVVAKRCLSDRRLLAFAIRGARQAASQFRRENEPPAWA